jgi:hypothetical protein
MKFVLAILLIALVVWNAYRVPGGEEYLFPKAESSLRYSVEANAMGQTLKGNLNVRNEGTAEISGRTYQEFSLSFEGVPDAKNKAAYSRWTEKGIYSRSTDKANAPEFLELPLPPTVGHKWRYKEDNLEVDAEIVSIESVTVGEKVYRNCVKVVTTRFMNGMRGQSTTYYSPRNGMVKSTINVAGMDVLTLSQKE